MKDKSPIPVNYFTNDSRKEISAIIFSDKDILNSPSTIGSDCVFINNPFAVNPVNFKRYSFLKSWKATKNKITKLY